VRDQKRSAAARLAAILAASGLLLSSVGATTTSAATPTDLFFSEYIEGATGFNKAFELYNGTGAPIELTGYTVELYINGATTAGETIVLSGSIPTGAAFVAAHPSADAGITVHANMLNNQLSFNGNDALVLKHAGVVIDSIGQVGDNPLTGWGVDPTNTVDSDLRRKPTITAGDTNPSDAYDPGLEWDGFVDTAWDDLGAHATDTGGGGGGGGGGEGSEEGTVTAVLTPQAVTACIELSTTQISFGDVAFGAEGVAATPEITITNCSTAGGEVIASASNATSIGGASWALVDDGSTCGGDPDLGQNQYRLSIDSTDWEGGPKPLSTANTSLTTFAAGQSIGNTALIWTACPGSSGDGETLQLQINYLAVVQED
jgi:uncharacterized protein